jgi:hypothetical protein
MRELVSLRELVFSDAYRKVGTDYYKSMQLFVLLALFYIFFFDYNGGLLIFIAVAFIWATFGISLLIALPFFAFHAFLVSRGKKNFSDKFLWLGHILAVISSFKIFTYVEKL